MSKAGVYKLTAPNGKCYVGQSINLDSRYNDYRNLKCVKQVKIYRALKKYGFESFTWEELYSTESELKHLNVLLNTLEIS